MDKRVVYGVGLLWLLLFVLLRGSREHWPMELFLLVVAALIACADVREVSCILQ